MCSCPALRSARPAWRVFGQATTGPPVAGAQPGAQPGGRLRPQRRRLALNLPKLAGAGDTAGHPALHLQHHRPVPGRAVQRPVVRHRPRQPARYTGTAGTIAAPGDGCGRVSAESCTWAYGPMWARPAAGPAQRPGRLSAASLKKRRRSPSSGCEAMAMPACARLRALAGRCPRGRPTHRTA